MTIKQKNISPIRLLSAVFIAAAAVVGGSILTTRSAVAACAAPSPAYGSATMQLTVPTTGTYRIWSQVNAPDTTNNSVLLEVDGGSCYVVGDSNLNATTWTWVNHQNGSLSSKISTTLTAGSHTFKVIGREPSVKIGRILVVADQNCTPIGLGDNCMASADTTKPAVTIAEPAEGSTASGSVTIKATATDDAAINKVEFSVQNNLVATDTSSPYEYNWNTAALANGTYTIAAKAYDSAGNSSTDTQAIIVKNGDTQAPTAPSDVTASAPSHDKVNLSWKASTDNAAVTAYRIVRNNSVIASVSGTSYTDTSAVAGVKYDYYIVAVDSSNNTSPASNTASVTIPKPTTTDTQAPTRPTDIVANAVSTSQINIAWKPSTDNIGVKEYDLYRAQGNGTGSKIATTTNTSYGDGGLASNTSYSYYVIARDASNNSSQASATVSATTNKPQDNTQAKSTLRGTVMGRNGRPLAGAKVTIWVNDKRYQATTNWRGRYIMTNIPSGRYEVSVRAHGYERKTQHVRLNPNKTKWQDINLRRY